jgi:serine/threonine protein kinase
MPLSDSGDWRGAGPGRDPRPVAATAVSTIAGAPSLTGTPDDELDEWLDRLSSGEMPAGDDGVGSSARAGEIPIGSSGEARLGRYQIEGILGEGRYARVYRGYDPILERAVALKVPRPGAVPDDRVGERFLGEARALARLRHPGIVPVFEMGHDAGRCFIAMALIDGHSLAELHDRQREHRSIDFRRAAEIVADVALALDHAHGHGVLHRDVKPANILFDRAGYAYLTDFGLAHRPGSGELAARPGAMVGTPAYAAPEQASGDHSRVVPASDQYSLGAVLYELLCGRTPFRGPPLYVLYQVMSQDPPSPRAIQPAVPAPLAAICLKTLARAPERRYGSCAELAEGLRRWTQSGSA